jgi:hypothetical protein
MVISLHPVSVLFLNEKFYFYFVSKMCSYNNANNQIKESREICNKVTIQETVHSLVEKLKLYNYK